MNDRKNEKKKKNSKGGIIAAVILMLIGLFEDGAEVAGISIAILIVIAGIIGVVYLVNKNKGKTAKKPAAFTSAPAYTGKAPSFSRETVHKPAAEKPAAFIQRAAIPVQPSRGDRYVEQLNGFLKNGLIEKEEYNILLRRWTGRK